jgi:hypothetical protein
MSNGAGIASIPGKPLLLNENRTWLVTRRDQAREITSKTSSGGCRAPRQVRSGQSRRHVGFSPE